MDSPEGGKTPPPSSPAPRGGLILMGAILFAMALLAVYSNVQKGRREQIETVTIIPASSPIPSPSGSPSPGNP
ncbi:MAG: hypothetical protein ABR589_06620 [Chthoniobacterales bacterium]